MAAPDVFVLYGPTASGKSAAALGAARDLPLTLINADAMQMYRELRILTARPPEEEMAQAPHRLYGIWPASQRGSAALWVEAAIAAIGETLAVGRIPILVGGTGLYLKMLIEGFSEIPPVPVEIHREGEALLKSLGNAVFHERLAALDPEAARRLDPGNSQRLIRAWEVVTSTGRSLYDWQQDHPPRPPTDYTYHPIALLPPRDVLRQRVEIRLSTMLEEGALEEVRQLKELNLDPSLPVMRAHGVPELIALLNGVMTQDEAIRRTVANIRQYVKRQETWLRNQFTPDLELSSTDTTANSQSIIAYIKGLQGGKSSSKPLSHI